MTTVRAADPDTIAAFVKAGGDLRATGDEGKNACDWARIRLSQPLS